jgi:hypothetical protein
MFEAPFLSPGRIRLAYAIAVAVDVLQFALGPLGWAFADEALDVAAALALSAVLGFHLLLLPTFALEFLPVADLLPTWTGCAALVVAMRKKEQARAEPGPAPGPFLDV